MDVGKGVDVKLLQYDYRNITLSDRHINIERLLQSTGKNSIIVINIEKDRERYHSTVDELKKLEVETFIHLKATYWKDRANFVADLNEVIHFLIGFRDDALLERLTINEFSEVSDQYIHIQDGPLACYCSHIRAMMYGYYHSDEYTVIIEDDIFIASTDNIEEYIKCIPDDWDIICLNAMPKNIRYSTPYYKFTDHFHSTHFYIVRNRCMPTLFRGMYPVVEQVDVLISNMIGILNIYNIVDTVYQRNISTNTQNNLHTIFTSSNYSVIREHIEKIREVLNRIANGMFPGNEHNSNIVDDLMFDFLYGAIVYDDTGPCLPNREGDIDPDLLFSATYVINSCKKGIDSSIYARNIMIDIVDVLRKFKPVSGYKPYNYGSTSQTYISTSGQTILKVYNTETRYVAQGHTATAEIMTREYQTLNLVYNVKLMHGAIEMQYLGTSLYDVFVLPHDWRAQVRHIFDIFDAKGIYYPEFHLKNILVHDDRISFVDFGLASLVEPSMGINDRNYDKFVLMLDLLNQRTDSNRTMFRISYLTLMNIFYKSKFTQG